MIDVSTKIYKRYKELNIFDMVYGKSAKWIKIAFVLLTLGCLIWYFSGTDTQKILGLFAYMAACGVFYLRAEKSFINKFGEHNSRRAKRNDKNPEDTKLKLLSDYIKEEELYNIEGIEYLIRIYSKRIKERKITGIALFAILVSAIINNIMYVGLMAGTDDWDRLYMYYRVIQDNLASIMGLLLVVAMYFFVLKKNIEIILFLKGILFYEGYSRLIEILELYFLPLVIKDSLNHIDRLEIPKQQACFYRGEKDEFLKKVY